MKKQISSGGSRLWSQSRPHYDWEIKFKFEKIIQSTNPCRPLAHALISVRFKCWATGCEYCSYWC